MTASGILAELACSILFNLEKNKMDALKKMRTGHRTAFTRALIKLNALLNSNNVDADEVSMAFERCKKKWRI